MLVRGAVMSGDVETALRDVLARKAVIADLNARISARESDIASIGRDQARVRENMQALGDSAEERQLRERYVRQLDAQETRLETLGAELAALAAERTRAQAALEAVIAAMSA